MVKSIMFLSSHRHPLPILRDDHLKIGAGPSLLDEHIRMLTDLRAHVHQRQASAPCLTGYGTSLRSGAVVVFPRVSVGLEDGAEG
jgi:hypothetical protein